jgi:hypothetical protein
VADAQGQQRLEHGGGGRGADAEPSALAVW